MSEHHPDIIIIKRKSSHEEEHHGGAWKIAFADFMTAMMAFFLVLWIINATDKHTKTIIARYFNPVRLEEPAKSTKGIRNANPTGDAENKDHEASAPEASKEPKSGQADKETKSHAEKGKEEKKPQAEKGEESKKQSHEKKNPAAPTATMSETDLFSDPYASLDQIAGKAAAARASAPEAGAVSPESSRFVDPFSPRSALAGGSDEPRKAEAEAPEPASEAPKPAEAKGAVQSAKPPQPSEARQAAAEAANAAKQAAQLLDEIEAKLPADRRDKGPAIEVRKIKDGYLISLTDNLMFSMFAIGSAEPQRQAIEAMTAIAKTLEKRPGRLVVQGYTDGRPYRSKVYDNWRLSSARAQMAYYMLTRAGLPQDRFERIEGHADRDLKIPKDPLDPRNRRIDILLRESGA